MTIHGWCQNIDYGRNLPLLGILDGRIAGVATLHQQLGGWKRHVGRVSVLVHPQFRGRGLARTLMGKSSRPPGRWGWRRSRRNSLPSRLRP